MEIEPELTQGPISLILHSIKRSKTHPFISQFNRPLDLEGINNEVPKELVEILQAILKVKNSAGNAGQRWKESALNVMPPIHPSLNSAGNVATT